MMSVLAGTWRLAVSLSPAFRNRTRSNSRFVLLCSLPLLLKVLTALPEDPGLACVRGLVTRLLCFYNVDTSLAILEAVVPTTLI
jgi:hypothetical protein